MIRNSFVFIDGIGPKKERALWRRGIDDWEQFLNAKSIKGISKQRKETADAKIHRAREALYKLDSAYFARSLEPSEQWRLYDFFKEEAVFLDIETNGVNSYSDITVVGLYDGMQFRPYVKGINLDYKELREDLSRYKLMVTFNGASFDLPFLRTMGVLPDVPHVDLKHVCHKIGLKGGLKEIERTLGLTRSKIVDGLHGGDALSLWRIFRATGDRYYLDLLLEYNEEDCVNLKPLAEHAIKELEKQFLPIPAIVH